MAMATDTGMDMGLGERYGTTRPAFRGTRGTENTEKGVFFLSSGHADQRKASSGVNPCGFNRLDSQQHRGGRSPVRVFFSRIGISRFC